MNLPRIIQGGMGASISNWRLARAVSSSGHLGVVSGTALDAVLARRLQLGDIGGHMRRALSSLPVPGVAERILDRYFIEGGKEAEAPFKPSPIPVLMIFSRSNTAWSTLPRSVITVPSAKASTNSSMMPSLLSLLRPTTVDWADSISSKVIDVVSGKTRIFFRFH